MTAPTIYALSSPAFEGGCVMYVGRTIRSPRRRLAEHLRAADAASPNALYQWIGALPRGSVRMTILQTLAEDATALEVELAEAYWIRFYTWDTARPKPLLNRSRSRRFRSAVERDSQRPPQNRELAFRL